MARNWKRGWDNQDLGSTVRNCGKSARPIAKTVASQHTGATAISIVITTMKHPVWRSHPSLERAILIRRLRSQRRRSAPKSGGVDFVRPGREDKAVGFIGEYLHTRAGAFLAACLPI